MVPLKNQANRPLSNKVEVVTVSARLKHRCELFDPWFKMRATAAANQLRIYAPIGTKFGEGVSTHEGEGFRLHVAGRPHP